MFSLKNPITQLSYNTAAYTNLRQFFFFLSFFFLVLYLISDFKHAEEQFYTVQAKHLNLSLLKKRKAVMATDKDLDEAASKLQAIMRGRKARQAENKKKEEAKKREEVLKKKKRLLLQQENLSNEQIQSAQKLQALIRGRSSRKKNKKSKNKKQINNKRK